jgi:hypothetical protein
MRTWLSSCPALLLLALTGCEEIPTSRQVQTDVTCSSAYMCDLDARVCTSSFDEIFTTFIDEYGDDFDHHITITDETQIVRQDDLDDALFVAASWQTERLTTTTTDVFISIDDYGHEELTTSHTVTVALTTWQQDCPTCLITVCTTNESGGRTCALSHAPLPALPVCREAGQTRTAYDTPAEVRQRLNIASSMT